MKRLQKAVFLVPLIFAAVLAMLTMGLFPQLYSTQNQTIIEILAMIIVAFLVLIQLMILVFGTPYYIFLRNRDAVTKKNILLGGAIMGAFIGVLLVYYSRVHPLKMQMIQVGFYSFCGLIIAYLFWHLGIKPQPKDQE